MSTPIDQARAELAALAAGDDSAVHRIAAIVNTHLDGIYPDRDTRETL